MPVREIRPGIYSVGAIDWERRLFDELIPLPDGTSYNAYLIKGEQRAALLDTVDPTKEQELVENLKKLGLRRIDYIVSHHAEQDHSGAIPRVLELYPEARVATNARCKNMLIDHLHIPEDRFIAVEDGGTLPLGGKTLEFILTPWVHWPETMLTYLREDKILFTCDFLGSHLATGEIWAVDEARVYKAAKRYYAEIMMPFRANIKRHLERIEKLEVEIIAPSHGPIYPRPAFILDAYREWVSDEVKDEVLIVYVSMHGSTVRMVRHLIEALLERGVPVKPFNLTTADLGELAIALVDAATLVLATPTVLAGPHPGAVSAAYLVNALRPKLRFAAIIGSYGWGGRTVEQVKGLLSNLKIEMLEPVLVRGLPRQDDLKALERLADEIVEKHREHGIAGKGG